MPDSLHNDTSTRKHKGHRGEGFILQTLGVHDHGRAVSFRLAGVDLMANAQKDYKASISYSPYFVGEGEKAIFI